MDTRASCRARVSGNARSSSVADVINRTFPRLLLIVSPSNLDAPPTPGSYTPTKPGWPADARSPQDAVPCRCGTLMAAWCSPILLPPCCHPAERPDRRSGDQALTCTYLVAGAGFEPATSGL